MKIPLTLATVFIMASVSAQTQTVIPKDSKNLVTPNNDSSFLGANPINLPVHVQWNYDPTDLGVPVALIKQIAFRRNNYYTNGISAHSNTLTVEMSAGRNAALSPSTTFASNHGSNKVQVFSGNVNWPSSPYSGRTKNAPFVFPIKFASPYVFVLAMGKSLVLDIVLKTSTRSSNIMFDAVYPANGKRVDNSIPQSSCRFSNNKYVRGLTYDLKSLTGKGGQWFVSYHNCIPNSVGVAFLSAFGLSNISSHNWPLPIDLRSLGAPGCSWYIGLEAAGFPVFFKTDASGRGRLPNLTIPRGLAGRSFFDHALIIDRQANALGLVATLSSEWQIVKAFSPKVSVLYMTRDSNSSATGLIAKSLGIVVELTQ